MQSAAKIFKKEMVFIKIVVENFEKIGGAAKIVSIIRKIMRILPFQEFSMLLHHPDRSSTLHQ